MLDRVLLLAAAASSDGVVPAFPQQETSKLFGLGVRDLMLLLGVAVVIAATLFFWVYLTRREGRRHLSRSPRIISHAERRRDESDDRRRVRKRRRDHPDNLPRNPTLGETGGLPPIRPDEPAQPA